MRAAPGLVLGELGAPVAQAARDLGVALDRGAVAVAALRAAMDWTASWRLKLVGQGSRRCPAGSP